MMILLADDHALVRENLRDFLAGFPLRADVIEAGTLPEAIEVAKKQRRLDLIILDLMMPGMCGIAGVKEMTELYPKVPVVVLSGSTRHDEIEGAIKLGARGFIPKTKSGTETVEILRTVLDGEVYVPNDTALSAVPSRQVEMTANARSSLEHESFGRLTPRERQVLGHLVKGYANKRIATSLDIQEITVKVHLQNIYRKFGVSNRTHAVARALEFGWLDSQASAAP